MICLIFFFVFGGGANYFFGENVPFLGYEGGIPKFFLRNSRQQYGIESLIFTSSALIFSLFIILSIKFLRS